MSKVLKDALKGRIPVVYARVSTREQKKTLPDQISEIVNELKSLGIKRKPVIYQEQVSGSKRIDERPALNEMNEYLKGKAGKAAVVVRDTQRISRNPWIAGAIVDPWRRLEIPLVSFEAGGKVASTDSVPQVDGDLLMPILTAVGGQELSIRKEQTLKGVKAAKAKGIYAGTPLSLYPTEAVNPWPELVKFVPLMAQGKISGAEVSRRLGRATSWMRKAKARVSKNLEANIDIDEWLNVLDMIRKMEQKHGQRFGKGAKKPMKAVARMTGGYIQFPWDFPAPTQADLDEYFTNYKLYLPKRSK